MDFVAGILEWISQRESLLSGAAALIVLVSVLISGVGLAYRALNKRNPGPLNDKSERADNDQKITLRTLSAPAPFDIHFADSDGLKIAYAVSGNGPVNVVMAPGIISHLNVMSHLPLMRNTLNELGSFARVVAFDKRGQGLSDPCMHIPDLEQRAHDIGAVMDAAGMDKAILYGISEGGPMCIKFAHDFPERVAGLVLLGTTSTWVQRDDFPIGLAEKMLDAMAKSWGNGTLRDIFYPGISREVMDDEAYKGFEKLVSTRDSIRQLVAYMKETDVRGLLPEIQCPSLVIHFSGDLAVPMRMGRALADGLPNAEFLEASGVDHADLTHSPEAVARVKEFSEALATQT
ncbi:MAG: alpha/beta hydrolase [Halieaceae bacterium]